MDFQLITTTTSCIISLSCHVLSRHSANKDIPLSFNRFIIYFELFCSIHWIPTECYSNFDFARGSVAADVWAFGTTLWEIFAYGECPPETTNVNSMMKVQFIICVCCNYS
jgi:hypothetical protein